MTSITEEPEWLSKKRKKAWEIFTKSEMLPFFCSPGIQARFPVDFDLIETTPAEVQISADSAVVIPFSRALDEYGNIVRKFFASSVPPDNKLRALHYAKFSGGVFIYVPEGTEATIPSAVTYSSNKTSELGYTLIIAEPGSSLTLIEKHNSLCKYRSGISEIFLQKDAQLNHITVQSLGKCNNFNVRKATVEKNSFIKWFDCTLGSKVSITEILTHLHGSGSGVKNLGVFYGTRSQHFDIYANTIHDASNTECDMFTRGVLQDNATAVYRGLIEVKKNAPQCNSYQKEDVLLLNDDARSIAVPKLDIKNNEVRCTHGVTVSQLDQNQVFYLMSRGLSYSQVKNIIVSGFFESVFRQLPIVEIKNRVLEAVKSNN